MNYDTSKSPRIELILNVLKTSCKFIKDIFWGLQCVFLKKHDIPDTFKEDKGKEKENTKQETLNEIKPC